MKPHHLLAILLVTAEALLAAVLGSAASLILPKWPHPLAIVILGVAMGQLALAAAWLVWGTWNVALRAGFLLVLVSVWTYPTVVSVTTWIGGPLLLYSLLTAILLAVVRMRGVRLTHDGEFSPPTEKRWWQFTIGGLLSLTTLVAVGLVVGRNLLFPWQDMVRAGLFCLAAACGAAAAIVLALRIPHTWPAVGSPLLACAAGGLLLRLTLPIGEQYHWVIPMTLVQGAVISLAIVVLRIAGYRLEPMTRPQH